MRCSSTARPWSRRSTRAFDFANATEANANQGGLFDIAATRMPPARRSRALVEAPPWGVKERLT